MDKEMINRLINGNRNLTLALSAGLLAACLLTLPVAVAASYGSVSAASGSQFSGSTKNQSQFPRISAAKSDYAANQTVVITGTDFESFERVRFAVGAEDKSGMSAVIVAEWDVYADGKGRISTTWDMPATGSEYSISATGSVSGKTATTEINSVLAESVNIEQCANTNAVPQNKNCPSGGPAGWVPGLVGNSKALYFEGDFIAYRNIMQGLTPGNTYKWTVEYDVTKGGLNAIDYLGSYNYSITNANPCRNGANANGFCTAGAPTSTFAIPSDPVVAAGRDQVPATSDDITQIPGVISAWNATVTAVSLPTYSGPFPVGDESATVDITFVANSSTVVIAWGGHISTRSNWGQAFGSVNISGSPYHTSNGGLMNITAGTSCCGGSQDLQLQAAAVTPTSKITIVKVATPESSFAFGFSATNLPVATFSLTDDGTGTLDRRVFDGISTFNVKTITETDPGPYMLVNIQCTVNIGTNGTPAPTIGANSASIDIRPGDEVTCTFFNDFVTAAEATVSGRVLDASGAPVRGAWVSATDANGSTRFAQTNQFGYYTIRDLEAGGAFYFDVAHKVYIFGPRYLTIDTDLTNVDFVAEPR